ncbi:DUF2802 domain-containing protein [Aquisalimonas asiatica]|uniref:DUF2802 domain-containing protein n=1 Tax=Aquisalimonas asiatica TaxID=406100 RepID=A0A1H8QSD3_9GAMM|nr:DUF2802 domain-containing protein [Aquisalimonas asiatica]SEO56888.1 Protein of unknown function [Aquisalimonas asiatica]
MTLSVLIAVAALVIAIVAAAVVIVQVRRAEARLSGLRHERRRVLESVEGLSSGAVAQGERVARLEQELRRLKERLSMLSSRETSSEAFEQAIRMARKGQTADEIASSSGLSKVEADLVVLIHQEHEDDI